MVVVRFHNSFASGEFWTFCLFQMKLRPAFSPSAKSFRARAMTKDDIGEDFVTYPTSYFWGTKVQRKGLNLCTFSKTYWFGGETEHFHCVVDPIAVQAFLFVYPNFQ